LYCVLWSRWCRYRWKVTWCFSVLWLVGCCCAVFHGADQTDTGRRSLDVFLYFDWFAIVLQCFTEPLIQIQVEGHLMFFCILIGSLFFYSVSRNRWYRYRWKVTWCFVCIMFGPLLLYSVSWSRWSRYRSKVTWCLPNLRIFLEIWTKSARYVSIN